MSKIFIIFLFSFSSALIAQEQSLQQTFSVDSQQQLSTYLQQDLPAIQMATIEKLPSCQLSRLRIGAYSYLVYKAESQLNEDDFNRQATCVEIAARALVAPELLKVFVADRCFMMKDQRATNFFVQPRYDDVFIKQLAKTTKTVHGLVNFPQNKSAEIQNLLQRRRNELPQQAFQVVPELSVIQNQMQQIQKEFEQSPSEQKACHNDLNPLNLLYADDDINLVGWDKAGLNNPWMDVATLLNFTITKSEQVHIFLQNYLGRETNAKEQRQIFLAKQLSLYQYGLHFLKQGCKDVDLARLDYVQINKTKVGFLQEMQEQKQISINKSEEYILFARILFKEIKENLA